MGRAFMGQGSIPHIILLPKFGNKKLVICKRLEKN
jgi:hypothetical protein